MPIYHLLGNFSGNTRISDAGLQPDWVADVNGLMEYPEGTYHLFHQYGHSLVGGNGWAHSVSSDLVRWRNLPNALEADRWYDRTGAWDGSLTLSPDVNDGVPVIVYDTNPGKNISTSRGPALGKDPPHVGIARPADLTDPLLLHWIKDAQNPLQIQGLKPKDQVSEPSELWKNGNHTNFLSAGVRYFTTDPTLRTGWSRDPREAPFAPYGGGPLWFEPLPGTLSGAPRSVDSPTHMISARGSHCWRLGWYHAQNESLTLMPNPPQATLPKNLRRSCLSTDSSPQFNWGIVHRVNNGTRQLNIGWIVMGTDKRGVVNGTQAAPNSALSMLREIHYDDTTDPQRPGLVAEPLPEYSSLRNGSYYNNSKAALLPGQLFTPALAGPGHTIELLATFALSAADRVKLVARAIPTSPDWVDSFVVSVLATSAGTHNSTLITANVSAPNNDTGTRLGVLSVGRPLSTSRQGIAVNWTTAFELPTGATELDVRVFVDRSVVEVFVAGVAGIQAYQPPSTAHTFVHVMSEASTTVGLQAWSMGCGWEGIRLKTDDIPFADVEAMLDTVIFGNAASEVAHKLVASGVDVSTKRGQPCRTPCSQPSSCHSGWPSEAALTFRMKVDPSKQNYLTVKFDGSETTATTAVTLLNESFGGSVSDCSYPPELNLCYGTGDGVSESHCGDPVFEGRWQYSTMLLPPPMTTGQSHDTLVTLTTLKGHVMQSVFRAYTHTSALPPLPTDEIQPPPPPCAGPMPTPPSSSQGGAPPTQFAFLLAQVDAGVEQMMSMQLWGPRWDAAVAKAPSLAVLTGGIWAHSKVNEIDFAKLTKQKIKDETLGHSIGSNNNFFRGLEVMSRAFHFKHSRYFRSADVLRRITAGVDFYQLAQGLNGGFDPRPRLPVGWIGAPNRRNGSGCLEGYGHMGFSAAVELIVGELSDDTLAERVDADDTGAKTMSRRDAWTRLLVNSRDYLLWNRGHAPNQDLADVLAAQLADSALAMLSPESRLPRAAMLRAAKQAVGVLGQPGDDGRWKPPPGAGPVATETAGFWFSKQGISMEPNTNVNGGYSHGYGDEEWALGWLAALTADDEILAVARQHVRNFARFRTMDNCQINTTAAGFVAARCMRLESAITWCAPACSCFAASNQFNSVSPPA